MVKVQHRESHKFFDTIYLGLPTFLSVRFVTSLLASLTGGLTSIIIDDLISKDLKNIVAKIAAVF